MMENTEISRRELRYFYTSTIAVRVTEAGQNGRGMYQG
jgi:hypothetical protein